MKDFISRRWFLCALVVLMLWGMLWPNSGALIQRLDSSSTAAVIIFLMALPLQATAIQSAMVRPAGAFSATCINILYLPLAAKALGYVLTAPLAEGLLISACIPSTLASSAVLSRRANGNEAVALLVMAITNVTCFIYTPALLNFLSGKDVSGSGESTGRMILHLLFIVVLPLLMAQIIRQWRPIGSFATRYKSLLSLITQFGLLSMIFKGAVTTGSQLSVSTHILTWNLAGLMLIVVAVLHLSALWFGYRGTLLLGGSRADAIGAGLSGSQKTLMVGLDLATEYFPQAMILPIVAYHCCQLILDTMIADYWADRKH